MSERAMSESAMSESAMRRTVNTARRRREGGYALVFALTVMVVILVIGLRFLAVVHSRQKTTNNEKDALQAVLLADAGIERAACELSQDMTWRGSFSEESLAGGTYSAHVTAQGTDYVVVQSEGAFRDVIRRRIAYVYTPESSGSVHTWASCYGTGTNDWNDMENLIDCADGETGTYAYHQMGAANSQMSLAGFCSDLRSVPDLKVEIVISGYTDNRARSSDALNVRWVLPTSEQSGRWHRWPSNELTQHVGARNTGRMYLDVTDDPPSGGWHWGHFGPGADLELEFESSGSVAVVEPVEAELQTLGQRSGRGGRDPFSRGTRPRPQRTVTLYVDCAGFRVTWGQ
jgi:Tfp pilus assembly protein PilX